MMIHLWRSGTMFVACGQRIHRAHRVPIKHTSMHADVTCATCKGTRPYKALIKAFKTRVKSSSKRKAPRRKVTV